MANIKYQIHWDKYTPFQRKVYQAILKIPAGQVWTYAQVARKIGQPKAARAVGMALKRNQDAPIIPCHRVVGSRGIGGYSGKGGVRGKIKLLKKEGYLKNIKL
jgi:methylated-DNA-[protein]-cysteine S-methyltransferase